MKLGYKEMEVPSNKKNGGVNYYDFGVKEGYKYTSMRVESSGSS